MAHLYHINKRQEKSLSRAVSAFGTLATLSTGTDRAVCVCVFDLGADKEVKEHINQLQHEEKRHQCSSLYQSMIFVHFQSV